MQRKNKHHSYGFGLPEMLLLLFVASLVVLSAWFVYKNIRRSDDTVPQSAQQEQAIEKAKIVLQNKYRPQLTQCDRTDNRTHTQRMLAFHQYFKVNSQADRAIMRGCNDIDQLYAKTKAGEWFPLFALNADRDQDNSLRKACHIQDITTGFDDHLPENASDRQIKKNKCNNIEWAYREYVERLKVYEKPSI